nr:hypothetical protein [Tanacetum cinerariifolium]
MPITAAEEKAHRRLDVKARSTLMIGIPNEYQLKFNSIKDAKKLLEAVEKSFGYALWEVIENGATLPKTKVVKGVIIEMPITAAEEKAHRRLDVKARSTLMIGIPNEYQLKFNSIKDAKKLLEAVEKSFVNNAQAVNTAQGVSTASTQVNATYSRNIDILSDAIICSFFASQQNSP